MSGKDREYVTPAGQPSITPSIPSLQLATPTHHLTTAQRLKALHRSVQQCGFTSLADALNAELLCVDRGAASMRAVAFYSGFECAQLLTTIVSSTRFNRQVNSTPEFKDFRQSFMGDTLEREIDTLACSKDSQCQMKAFTAEHIEKFIPKLLDAAHRRHAPLVRNVLHRMTKADQYPPGLSSADHELECDIPTTGRSGAGGQRRHRDRGLIAITALCMFCYGRNDRPNALQGLLGFFLFATNTAKRCVEVLHRFGLSAAYETVIRALRGDGNA